MSNASDADVYAYKLQNAAYRTESLADHAQASREAADAFEVAADAWEESGDTVKADMRRNLADSSRRDAFQASHLYFSGFYPVSDREARRFVASVDPELGMPKKGQFVRVWLDARGRGKMVRLSRCYLSERERLLLRRKRAWTYAISGAG